ncbi:MAG: hypothetical protein LBK58_04990 [Prevotellaceae bacterium]|jgi:hypothetical protein|nr:hypothetical protein [Prevotellaceae bacterium]
MLTDSEIAYIEQNTDYDVLNHGEYDANVINRYDSDGEEIIIDICGMYADDIINYLILCAQWSEKDSTAGDLKAFKDLKALS